MITMDVVRIPHEMVHGDTIVTTLFARSEVTQVFGERFSSWEIRA